jgi:hypothetical protein
MNYHWRMVSIEAFRSYHPLFVEGMGGYDTRDPARVANTVVASVKAHWEQYPPSKPPLLIIQGDPLEPKGISAITPRVAKILQLQRGLIVLDEGLADYHFPNADRDNVILETRYSEAVAFLERHQPGSLAEIESAVDALLAEKNQKRASLDKPAMADYYRIFALLQEVSKAAFAALCGEITLVHTSGEIGEFSVTSFGRVGLDLRHISISNVVPFLEP